jgi:hypothetical protein
MKKQTGDRIAFTYPGTRRPVLGARASRPRADCESIASTGPGTRRESDKDANAPISGNRVRSNDQETFSQTPFWNTRIVRSHPWVCS